MQKVTTQDFNGKDRMTETLYDMTADAGDHRWAHKTEKTRHITHCCKIHSGTGRTDGIYCTLL